MYSIYLARKYLILRRISSFRVLLKCSKDSRFMQLYIIDITYGVTMKKFNIFDRFGMSKNGFRGVLETETRKFVLGKTR